MSKKKQTEVEEVSVEQKLQALFTLQQIDSQIDKIKIIRGELPLEVQDLEDEIAGLETRSENFEKEVAGLNETITGRQTAIKDSKSMIKKYDEQIAEVKNNREYDSLTKELDYQKLEIELSEKKVKEARFKIENLENEVAETNERLKERKIDLDAKKGELDDIVKDTENEEDSLAKKSVENEKFIEDRLVTAYKRIRENARNGLAVVQIERDACGGCFNKIPPQHQLDIRMHKKIIVCDYCGRILIDEDVADVVHEKFK